MLYATIGGQNWQMDTWEQVSNAYLRLIQHIGRVSRAPQCKIIDAAGEIVAYVTVTGVVWSPDHNQPFFDPNA